MALMRLARSSAANHLRSLLSSSPSYSSCRRAGYTSFLTTYSKLNKWTTEDNILKSFDHKETLLLRITPLLIHEHGFARAATPPPHLQRQMGMKLYQESAGVIIEPYRVHSRLPFFKRWFTKEGWKEIKESLVRELKTAYTVAKLRQKAGYSKKKFYAEARMLYEEISRGIAEGNRNALRQLVTENMLSVLKKELKQREGLWARVHWETVGPITIRTLQGRTASLDAKNLDAAIIQVTLMIRSKQKFGAFDKDGKLVAGDPSKEILVEEMWIFETMLQSSDRKWRLCGRVSL